MTKPVHLIREEHPSKEMATTFCNPVIFRDEIIVTSEPMNITCKRCIESWSWFEIGKKEGKTKV